MSIDTIVLTDDTLERQQQLIDLVNAINSTTFNPQTLNVGVPKPTTSNNRNTRISVSEIQGSSSVAIKDLYYNRLSLTVIGADEIAIDTPITTVDQLLALYNADKLTDIKATDLNTVVIPALTNDVTTVQLTAKVGSIKFKDNVNVDIVSPALDISDLHNVLHVTLPSIAAP